MMIETLVGKTIVHLNNMQLSHWQTKSYSEHEGLGEYYTKLNTLNDRLVETYQGNANLRVHIESGQHTLQNYQSCDHTVSEIVQYGQDLAKASYDLSQKNNLHQYEDLLSILEDMAEAVSQVQYHLSLK
tara:strand:- start:15811 stop:16197 length:387 start_codon:yes stop_codon:yes gene_type:complete